MCCTMDAISIHVAINLTGTRAESASVLFLERDKHAVRVQGVRWN